MISRLAHFRRFMDRLLNRSSKYAPLMEGTIVFLVFIMCAAFVAETYTDSPHVIGVLHQIEFWITVFFIIEYLTRWWSRRFSLRYLFTPFAIIDLCSILPIFFIGHHYRFIRLLRLFRILRLLRFLSMSHVLFSKAKAYQLKIMDILFSLFTLIFISAGVIFDIEQPYNQDFKTFFDGFYFSVVTLTTVGFGDIVPITRLGRAFTIVMIGAGITLIPFWATQLARSFISDAKRNIPLTCFRCGAQGHDLNAKYCFSCGRSLRSALKSLPQPSEDEESCT